MPSTDGAAHAIEPPRALAPAAPVLDTRFARWLLWFNGSVPAALLVWDAYQGQLGVNEVNFAIRTTGLVGLVFLVLSLLVTPLRKLTGWAWLIALRRSLGLFAFFYLAAHFVIFLALDREWSLASTLDEIVSRRYLWFGAGALLLMIPLAITSTDGMVARLGAKRWKLLHRLAYPIAIAGGIHYLLLVKADTTQPIAFLVAIGALLLYRIARHYVDLHAEIATTKAKLATARAAGPQRRAFWSGSLEVARIFQETPDVKTFRLVVPGGGRLPFEHVAGQYLNLKLAIGGKRVNRSYTIASSPGRAGYCEISVKRTAAGYASHHLHDTVKEGDRIEVAAPAGTFVFAGHEAERIVLIAGGVGITPMMAIVRHLTDHGWRGGIYLLFSVRRPHDIVFAHELRALQERFANLHVQVTVTDPDAAWTGTRGQITREVIAGFVPELTRGPVLLCGPDPMMTAMRAILVGMGVPDADVKQEAFVSPPAPREGDAGDPPAAADEPAPGAAPRVEFRRAGTTVEVTSGLTVLEAAEDAGVAIPFECRSGICGQCKTRLVSGRVAMEVQDALTAADRKRGLILACQARAVRDVVVDA